MSQTVIRGTQILNNTVQRQDLDISTVGQAVVTKLVQGSGISLSSTGADAGTGDVTVSAAVPIADNTQSGLLRQVSGNTTDFIDGTNNSQPLQPVIWSARLRSWNSVGNPNFEVDQRNVGAAVTNPASGTFLQDRWVFAKSGTMTVTSQQTVVSAVSVPGTNFAITSKILALTLTGQQTTLGASDSLSFFQTIEGPQLRELINDVHSISLLVSSSVAPLKFSVSLRDSPATKSLVKLCTIPTANTWTLITLPNIPVWPTANFSLSPGTAGYILTICLAAGTSVTAAAADTWQNANVIGAPGMDNWASKPITSTIFYIAYVGHEPGAQCTTPIDCPFTQNLSACERYFQKSYNYAVKPFSVDSSGAFGCMNQASQNPLFWVPFRTRMAKTPTPFVCSPATGTNGTIRNVTTNTDLGVNSANGTGETGYAGVNLSAFPPAAAQMSWHWIAETTW